MCQQTEQPTCFVCSCLSEGDWVEVSHDGVTYDLRVRELHPTDAVSSKG